MCGMHILFPFTGCFDIQIKKHFFEIIGNLLLKIIRLLIWLSKDVVLSEIDYQVYTFFLHLFLCKIILKKNDF